MTHIGAYFANPRIISQRISATGKPRTSTSRHSVRSLSVEVIQMSDLLAWGRVSSVTSSDPCLTPAEAGLRKHRHHVVSQPNQHMLQNW